MNTVYVVMGNDYPDAVFSTQDAADDYCARMRELDQQKILRGEKHPAWPGIHWRTYDFTVDPEMEPA